MKTNKRKIADKMLYNIGFVKSIENDKRIEYYRYNTHYTTQYLIIKRDESPCNCFVITSIYVNNSPRGSLILTALTLYEKILCKRKAKEKGWKLKL